MIKNNCILNLLLIACLSSCTFYGIDEKAPALQKQEEYSTRGFDDQGLEDFIKAHDGNVTWLLNKWSVENIIWAALYFNPNIKLAESKINEAKAAEITAGQIPNPTIGIAPGRDTSSPALDHLLAFSFNLPVETNGKRGLRENATGYLSDSSRAQFENTVWDVHRDVISGLIDYYSAKQIVSNYQSLIKAQQEIVASYDKRTAEGQLPTAAVSQANIAYQQNISLLNQAQSNLMQAKARLAGSIGVPASALDKINIDYSELVNCRDINSIASLRKTSLENHPLLKASMMEYLAAHENLRLEVAKQIPDLDIGPGYEWNSQGGGKLSLGISIVLPIFNQNEGPIAEAKAKRETASRTFEVNQANIITTIEQAEAAYTSSELAARNLREIERTQGQKFEQLKAQLQESKVSKLPLLYAQSELYNARIAAQEGNMQRLKAMTGLEDALRVDIFGKPEIKKFTDAQ